MTTPDPLYEEAKRRAAAQVSPILQELQRQLEQSRAQGTALKNETLAGYEALANRAPGQEARVNEIYNTGRRSIADSYAALQSELSRLYGDETSRQQADINRLGISGANTSSTTDTGKFFAALNQRRAADVDSSMQMLQSGRAASALSMGEIARLQGNDAAGRIARQLLELENNALMKQAELRGQESATIEDIYNSLLKTQLDSEKAQREAKYEGIQGARALMRDRGFDPLEVEENINLLQTILEAHGQEGVQRKLSEFIPSEQGTVRNPEFDHQARIRRQIAIAEGSPFNEGDKARGLRKGPPSGQSVAQWKQDLQKELLMGTDDPEVFAKEIRYSAQRRNLTHEDTQALIDAMYAWLGQYS